MEFENLTFKIEKDNLAVNLYNNFRFEIPLHDIRKISSFKLVDKHTIELEQKEHKFNFLISKHIHNLKNTLNNKDSVYIHQNSEIPLIGTSYFGIVDRNTNIIELRPLTSCNLNCIFCSVDEGIDSKKQTDYIVEKDYLVKEFKKLVKIKKCDEIEACINPQGEPLLYSKLTDLIKDIAKIKEVKRISINTNATMLTKKKVDELIEAGLTRVNISLNSLDKANAEKIAGTRYNINKIKSIIKYASKKIHMNIAPVMAKGINIEDIEQIIKFTKELQKNTDKTIFLGIQNMLNYKFGRNPTKQIIWNKFYQKLEQWEKKYDINLKLADSFVFMRTKELEKPFRKDEKIIALLVCKGRLKNEMIASAKGRAITIMDCSAKKGQKIKVKILRSKHNIFMAKQI